MARTKAATLGASFVSAPLHRHLHRSPYSGNSYLPFQCSSSNYTNDETIFHANKIEDPESLMKYVRRKCRSGFFSSKHALSLFHCMKSLRPLPTMFDFNQLLIAMCSIKPYPPFSTVISLFRDLDLSGLRLDDYSLCTLFNCYCHCNHVELGFSIIAKIIKMGYEIVNFKTSIIGLIYSDKLDEAVQLLDKMIKLGFQPDLLVYESVLRVVSRTGDSVSAFRLFRRLESDGHCVSDVVVYDIIISSLCKDGFVSQALQLFSEMKTKHIIPDTFTYNALIRGLFAQGKWKDAHELVAEMLENNISPCVDTYTILIDIYGKESMIVEARAIFGSMIKSGMVPNIISYTALLNAYCLRGEMFEMEQLMNSMVKDGCEPNVVTFNCLIKGYCKSGKVNKALGLLPEMSREGLTPNVVTYSTLVDALCKQNRFTVAYQLFKEMEARSLKPDIVTWSSLLGGLCKNALIGEAMALLSEMEKNGVSPNIITYNVLIHGLFEARQYEKAMEIFSSLSSKGLQPNKHTYTMIIKGLCENGLLDDAIALVKKLEDNGCSNPDGLCDETMSVTRGMEENRMVPGNALYSCLIDGLSKAGQIRKAVEIFSSLPAKGLQPDAHTYHVMIKGLCRNGLLDEAHTLLNKMGDDGSPDT